MKLECKIGDKVYLKNDLTEGIYVLSNNNVDVLCLRKEVCDIKGQQVEILHISDWYYEIMINNKLYRISNDMIDYEKTMKFIINNEQFDNVNKLEEAFCGNKYKEHEQICKELNKMYETKNIRYDDAFSKSFKKYGITMACIRLEDKMLRFIALAKDKELDDQKDESIIDTLNDLANYAIMTRIELESIKKNLIQK